LEVWLCKCEALSSDPSSTREKIYISISLSIDIDRDIDR
jgi:hypothetical protein